MCGITGWLSTRPERFSAGHPLAQMQVALGHRGPDGQGAHVDPPNERRPVGAAIGFVRLAIRDVARGGQPMLGGQPHRDGAPTVVSTLNGELYDTPELEAELQAAGCQIRTRCDAELLAHGAAVWGDALWPKLEGMFAAAVWHPDKAELTLVRDGSGQKPLYVALVDDGQTVLWASELSGLLAHPALTPELDPRGVDALLWLDYVPSPGTLLRGVYKLPPGAIWRVGAGADGQLWLKTSALAPPWRGVNDNLSDAAATAALDARLGQAVRRRLVSDVPVGIFLSGGIDSSLVSVYAAAHLGAGNLQTLSVRFDERSFDESAHAKQVAAHIGTRHREIRFGTRDGHAALDALLDSPEEPLADPSLLVTRHLCAWAGIKVALGGDGGDEAWMGYPTFHITAVADLASRLPQSVRTAQARWGRRLPASAKNLSITETMTRFLDGVAGPADLRALTFVGGLPPDRWAAIHRAESPATAPWDAAVGWGAATDVVTQLAAESGGRDRKDRERRLLARTYLADGVLQKVDRASMAHGVEVRAPWLDRDVLALAYGLSSEQLVHGGRGKQIPRALATKYLPAPIVNRPKKGFGVPLSAWMRGPFASRMRHDLRPEAVQQVPGLDAKAITRWTERHIAGRADHRKTLFALWRLVRWWGALGS